jgi:hypothetical protein
MHAVCLLALALLAAAPAAAQEIQLERTLELSTHRGAAGRFVARLQPGDATVAVFARNLRGGAVQVDLAFRYRIPRDTIALDEVIERIELATEATGGEVFLPTVLETQEIPLNPNRVPLLYRATLYRPEEAETYVLRVRVIGNYE